MVVETSEVKNAIELEPIDFKSGNQTRVFSVPEHLIGEFTTAHYGRPHPCEKHAGYKVTSVEMIGPDHKRPGFMVMHLKYSL